MSVLLAFLLIAAPERPARTDPLAMLPAAFPVVVDVQDPSAVARRVGESALRAALGDFVPRALDDGLDALARLGAARATIGLAPRLAPPGISFVAIVEAADPTGGAGAVNALSKRGLHTAVLQGRLVVANSAIGIEGVRDVLEGRDDPLSSRDDVRAFVGGASRSALRFHADLEGLLPLRPGLRPPETAGEALLFAHWGWAAATARRMTGTLDLDHGLRFEVSISGPPLPVERAFVAPAAPLAPALAPNGAWLARLSLARDLAGFWERREELLPEGARSGFAEFQNTMSLLLGGLQVEDVFAGVMPGFDVFLGRLPADAGTPAHRYPMGAFVTTVTSERLRRELLVGFQEVIAFVNADHAAKGLPRLLLRTASWNGVEVHSARHVAEDLPAPDDDRVQLEPCFAIAGTRAILASHPRIARSLIDAAIEGREEPRETGDRLSLDLREAAAIAGDNEDALAAALVLRTGASFDEARAWLRRALEIAALAEGLVLRTDWKDGTGTVSLTIDGPRLVAAAPGGSGK